MSEYPELNPGDKVVLGKHLKLLDCAGNSYQNWSYDMDNYVGRETTILSFAHIEQPFNIPTYKVAIDGGTWHWRVSSMKILSSSHKINDIKYGMNCNRCNDFNQYVEVKEKFICYRCSH